MPDLRLAALTLGLIVSCAIFLLWGLHGRIWFILELRAIKLAGLCLVGASLGSATILFQTLSGNRILTPAIMGFDALFLLMQTTLVLVLGGFSYASLPGPVLFGVNTMAMMIPAVGLFGGLLKRSRNDIQLMILVGVIFGLLFRSLTGFMQRLIDPSEFAIVQGVMFARFGGINRMELLVATCLLAGVGLWLCRRLPLLDVMALGPSPARHLGVNYDQHQFRFLCAIAALVSISTALVGPVTFLGLLVSALAHSLMKTHKHVLLLPATALIAMIILVLGQTFF